MSSGWYPIIEKENCIGCGACNAMCRHGVYKLDEDTNKPKVVYGNGCVHGCHGCERRCPVGAIHYYGDDGTLDLEYDFETYRPTLQCEGKPKVAFVCNHNSCRSQIAEALGKLLASEVFDSYSAGTIIKNQINQDAVRMMKQVHDIDMEATQYNKTVDDIPAPDVVIFMGCNVSCPDVPCQYAENWGIDDPTGGSDAVFEETIATIYQKVLTLKEKLH